MKLILIALSLLICLSSASLAQTSVDPNTQRLLEQAARGGNPLASEITVNSSVHVQAVLIPRVDAKRIFGREISENYAVIQLIVGNKSPDAALIIHGVFIDYRDWPLSGSTPSALIVESTPNKYQAPSVPSQVASEEYRVVRGQLLDAQTDTLRNRFLRWLTLAGNLAGAFTFSLNEDGIVKGIAAVTGVGIPGVATAWPDKTVEQLNRVSDLGFRSNKVVPKESSEIIVCFFPIDRFLTPGFRKLFLRSPALFFAPLQMLADRTVERQARAAVGDFLKDSNLSFEQLRQALPCYMKVRHPDAERIGFDFCLDQMGLEWYQDRSTNERKMRAKGKRDAVDNLTEVDKRFYTFMALEFIGNVSLNRVSVTVDGTMAIDVKTIAGRIDEVEIDNVTDCGDADGECLWTITSANGGVRTGVIRGAYLKDAQLNIAEAQRLTITDLKKIDDKSTDSELRFTFKLNAPVSNQEKLHFTVTKPAAVAGAKPIESNTWEYVVAYAVSPTAISSVTVTVDNVGAPTKVTVKGKGFGGTPLVVTLIPQFGNSVTVTPTAGTLTDTSFDIALPTGANKLHAGCWSVQVTVPKGSSNKNEQFAVPPDPTLDSAARSDKFIFVKGKDLIDFGACGKQLLSFKALKSDGTTMDLEVKDWSNGSPLLNLPEQVKQGDWKVQVFMGTAMKGQQPLTVRP